MAVTDGTILIAVNLSMRADIPPGPVDLDVPKDANKWKTSSVVQNSSSVGAYLLSNSGKALESSGCIF